MFCKVLVLSVFFALALADEKPVIPIVAQESDIEPDGKFHWSYESGDGTKANQQGELKTIEDTVAAVMQGAFSYQGDDGKTYSISYTADENGYQPTGDHLPVAPEIPAPIQKALAYLATAPPPKEE